MKCPHCEEHLDKEEAIRHKKQFFHQACLEKKEQQTQDRKELIEYICELYGLEAPTGMILRQIKDFQEQLNYTAKGITLTLQYFHETLDNSVREGDGIGIVPYMYEEAKRHYINIMNIKKSVENLKGECVRTRVVRVKSPELQTVQKLQPVDISTL